MSSQTIKTFEVKWRIENIASWLQTRDDNIFSPQFLALYNTSWKLQLTPNWQLGEKYISLSLLRDIDDYSDSIELNYELSLMKCDGSSLKSKRCTTKFATKTIGDKLHLKEAEILKEKSGACLPDGVLTVCCKLWSWCMISAGECSLQTVIGTKWMNLNATIPHVHPPASRAVNFLPPSSDVSLVSVDVYVSHERFLFQMKKFECKSFSWHYYKLFAIDCNKQKVTFDEIINNEKPDISNNAGRLQNISWAGFFGRYIPRDILTLELKIAYHPSIVSESINVSRKCVSIFANLNNFNLFGIGNECNRLSDPRDVEKGQSIEENESCDESESDDESESNDENECLSDAGKSHLPSSSLKKDLTSLYDDRFFCDTKLQTDTETFPAHKNVLSVRSPVFKKMFTIDMKEKAGECINMVDISADTLRRMLQFIYTDCTGDLNIQSAKDLYVASDKYDISSLKHHCSSFMKNNLTPSNVCEVLILADMHQDKDLESAVQEFILENDKEVFGSDVWKSFMKNSGTLAAQVMFLKCMKE